MMAEEAALDSEVADGAPSAAYAAFVVMEDLLDKLKLLNYDKDFVRDLKKKALNKHYFVLQTNPGEQFYLFTSLAAWLTSKCGKPFEQPQESDDPNAVISNILDAARQLGITIDFGPSKLKQGFGPSVVYILDRLADEALKSVKFSWKRPQYPFEEVEDDVVIDDDAELTLAKVEEELMAEVDYDDEEDEENILGLDDLRNLSRKSQSSDNRKLLNEILEPVSDTLEWKLELERVLPQLKVNALNSNKDWRNRLEQIHRYYDDIETCLTTTKGQLEKLQNDISGSLDKITSREKHLNSQLEAHVNVYRNSQLQLEVVRQQYHQVNGGVVERSRQLAEITEELEMVKQEMEERSTAVTDGSPLINIRTALSRLKNEIVMMDIRIAVVEHTLLQARLREKSSLQQDMNASLKPSLFAEPVY